VKTKILHNFFSVILTAIVLLPFAIQTVHAVHYHEYTACDTKDVTHFHQHKVDCSSYHQVINQNSIDFLSEFNLEVRPFFSYNPTYFHQGQYSTDPQLKSSRGPPNFII